MTSRMEMAQPATRGICGMSRLMAIAVPMTCERGARRGQQTRQGNRAPARAPRRGQAYLCQISGDDGYLGHGVQDVVEPAGQEGTARLGQIEPGDGAELDAEGLQEDGKDVAEEHYEQQAEAVRGAGGNAGGVVPGIYVGHRDHEARADELGKGQDGLADEGQHGAPAPVAAQRRRRRRRRRRLLARASQDSFRRRRGRVDCPSRRRGAAGVGVSPRGPVPSSRHRRISHCPRPWGCLAAMLLGLVTRSRSQQRPSVLEVRGKPTCPSSLLPRQEL